MEIEFATFESSWTRYTSATETEQFETLDNCTEEAWLSYVKAQPKVLQWTGFCGWFSVHSHYEVFKAGGFVVAAIKRQDHSGKVLAYLKPR